jgi:antitoxin PrlF
MIATLTAKGQVTLPKEVRDAFELHPGDKLDFVIREDHLLEVVPMKQPARRLRGLLPRPAKAISVEEMNAAIAKRAAAHGRD